MMLHVRRSFAILFILISLGMIFWSLWTFPKETRNLNFNPADFQFAQIDQSPAVFQAILETHLLSLSWPQKMRTGEIQSIEAVFLPISSEEISETRLLDGRFLLDIFQDYTVIVEGRLEVPGLKYSPEGQISQLLQPNEPVTFIWNLKAENAEVYNGTAWIYLNITSKETGQEQKQVITAQLLEFAGVDFWGLDYLSTRLIGSVGLAIGIVLIFDRFFVDLWMLFESKQKKL